ncbi:MAG: PorT family protein [Bacteroidales bacterium]|nr:PorT family protein [Bacteroidales bacterium]
MKRMLVLVCVMMLAATASQAQLHYGVKAGANINSLSASVDDMVDQVKGATSYQFGVVFQAKALGFAIQPEVLYSVKSGLIDDNTIKDYLATPDEVKFTSQNIEVPINLQYGFDFGLARAYLQAGPYVSFVASTMLNGDANFDDNLKNSFKTFDFGAGVGAGIEVLNVQLAVKYDWGLGKIGEATIPTGVGSLAVENPFSKLSNKTLSVSLAYIF